MNDFTELDNGMTRYAIGDPVATTDAAQELLRVYAVELHVVGSDVSFSVEVPLRYDLKAAARREALSQAARTEAFRRACKLERAGSTTARDTDFVPGRVELLRQRLVPARAGKA